MIIKAIIVDDEPVARRSIRRFLKEHKDISVVRECSDGASAVTAILDDQPDLVFLDMHLPEMSGLEIISAIGDDKMPAVIVTTAHEQYAINAFETSAVDYMLKPFGKERFDKAVAKARKKLKGENGAFSSEQLKVVLERIGGTRQYRDRISVAASGRIVLVNVEDIHWIEAEGNHARLHTKKEVYDIRETLAVLEQSLDPELFIRIHRSTLVNVKRVKEIHPWFNGYHVVILEDGKQLRMSRYQQESVKRLLGA